MSPRTVFSLLHAAAEQHGTRPALHQPQRNQNYRSYNWIEYRTIVQELACGLREIGVNVGDVVALGSETRAEFYFCDIATMTAGARAAAMYISYPPADQVKTLANCGAKVVIVEDTKLLKQLREAGGNELGVQWVLMTGTVEGVLSLDDLRLKGRNAMARDAAYFENVLASVSPDDVAILYLTSGATGEPKMVEVTHHALVFNADIAPKILNFTYEDCALAFLPSAHIAQRIGIELIPLRMGVQVYFSEGLSKMPNEFRTVRPTFFLAPPRVWERVYASICTEIRKRSAVTRRMFYAALGAGSQAARYRRRGESVPAWLQATLKLADKLVFKTVRDRFGGRLKLPVSGAAPLSKDLAMFYEAIGMPLVEGYGLTEGGIVCLNPIDAPRVGTIGKSLPGCELKLSEDGELLIKSETVFKGYFKDPAATASVLKDGWLHTGDLAEINPDGFISITGRKKEMIVSSNGKKIYPSRIEGLFKTEPIISQMILLGDRQPFVSALFTVNTTVAETLKGMEEYKGKSMTEVFNAKPVQEEVKKAVQRANKQLAPFEQIRKFRVLDRDFTIDAGELTPTMKVRRGKVIENYRSTIGEIYSGKEEAV